jgi:hypothetical protein
MTDADEKDFAKMASAAQALMRADMERSGEPVPVFMVRHAGGEIERLPFSEESGKLMNIGRAKDTIFAFIRELVKELGLTAVCFATEAWVGKPTPAGLKVPPEEFHKATRNRGFQGDPEIHDSPQSDFGGRQKMYGDLREENLS